jgi:phosphoglycolate phosphatase-like HAD superfamily hydrolase
MRTYDSYDVYIFDCDGVVVDSNQLKIKAMKRVLTSLLFINKDIDKCIRYFSNNFGKSRFHHIEHFLSDIFQVEVENRNDLTKTILEKFSLECKTLYLNAKLTDGFIEFISGLNGPKYIASGSEQEELRYVFKQRGLDIYFEDILGSPEKKTDLVARIKSFYKEKSIVMFGDAISDFEAAKDNCVDFYAYIPYSNVKNKMKEYNFPVLKSWIPECRG